MKTILRVSLAVCLLALLPAVAWAQTIEIDYDFYPTSSNGPITGGDWLFNGSYLFADSTNGVTGGTQSFNSGAFLYATVADGVTGGQQILYGGGFNAGAEVHADATHGLSGANITLYDDALIAVSADDAFGSGAAIHFSGSHGDGGTQQMYLSGYNTTVGSIDSSGGYGVITNAGGSAAQLTISSGSYSGVITNGGGGALGLTKTGAGTLTLTRSSNAYSGGTTINAGTLVATNGALGSGNVTIGSAGTLRATGTITGAIALSGTLTNGTGTIGTLTTGAQTWNGGGSYAWDITNAAGAAGTGYDSLAINGGLGVTSSSGTPFTVAMNSVGRVAGFDSTANYTWTLATTTGITGLDPGDIALDFSNFSNSYNGTFSLGTSGNNVVLNYTGAPNIVSGNLTTSNDGDITSGVHQVTGALTVNTAGGISGGDTFALGTQVTHSDAITGGYQEFTNDYNGVILYATHSITGGTQVFNSGTDVYIAATDAISGGHQTFTSLNVLLGGFDAGGTGGISGGVQEFHGDSTYVSSSYGSGIAITGGTQKFYDQSEFEFGVNSTVSGGTQEFYNQSEFVADSGAIMGGAQNFHDNSTLIASAGAVNGGTLSFDGGAVLRLNGAGAITNSALTLGGAAYVFEPAAGSIVNTSILFDGGGAIYLGNGDDPFGAGTTISFRNGGALDISNANPTIHGLQSLTPGAGLVETNYPNVTSTLTVDLAGTTTNTFSGVLSKTLSANNHLALVKAGTGTLILSGANTYDGATTVSGGTLQFANTTAFYANTVNATTADRLTVASGATAAFNAGGSGEFSSANLDTLRASGHFASGSSLGIDTTNASGGAFNYASNIGSSIGLKKLGIGSLTLSGASTYTGPTAINGGKLVVDGSLSASSAVAINNTGTLGGHGTVGAVTINSGGMISPGNSPGTMNTGNETWAGGASYAWEINNATGTKGADPGYDWLNISGTLTLNNTSGDKFTIYVTSLDLSNVGGNPAVNFATFHTYVFPIVTATTDITGFSADKFLIDTSAFFNPADVYGTWSLVQSIDNKSLNLTFVTVPEPSTYAIGIAGLLGGIILLRRRRIPSRS